MDRRPKECTTCGNTWLEVAQTSCPKCGSKNSEPPDRWWESGRLMRGEHVSSSPDEREGDKESSSDNHGEEGLKYAEHFDSSPAPYRKCASCGKRLQIEAYYGSHTIDEDKNEWLQITKYRRYAPDTRGKWGTFVWKPGSNNVMRGTTIVLCPDCVTKENLKHVADWDWRWHD